MSLKGELQTMPLPDLLQWLDCVHRTGVLTLTNEQDIHAFHFLDGKISTGHNARTMASTEAQVRSALSAALAWPGGEFDFVEHPATDPDPTAPPALSAPALVLDLFRLSDECEATLEHVRVEVPPDRDTVAMDLRRAVVSHLLDGKFNVPLLPTVVKKILDVTGREDYELSDLSDVIVTDQVVAGRVLRQANSAYYASSGRIESLLAAVQRLGATAVTNIVLSLSLQSLTHGNGEFLERKQRVWHHSLSSALFARSLGMLAKIDAELSFLCGLMTTFGKIVLLSVIEDLMSSDADLRKAPEDVVDEILETFHPNVGGMIGETWHLPEAVLVAVRHHHDPAGAKSHSRYVAAASLGGTLATTFANHKTPDEAPLTAEEAAAMPAVALLGLSEPQLGALLERAPEFMKFADDFLD